MRFNIDLRLKPLITIGRAYEMVFDREEPDIIIPCEGTYPYVRVGSHLGLHKLLLECPNISLELYLLGVEPETTHNLSIIYQII